jgi:hypothetical protein
MTGALPRIAVTSLGTALLLALLAHQPHRHHPVTSPVTLPTDTSGAETVARAFVVALTDLDATHPHGDLPQLRRLCDAPLLHQLLTTPTPPRLSPRDHTVQRGVVTAVAIRPVDSGAVALATVELTETAPSTRPLRVAVTFTLSMRRSNLRWLVTAATT